MDDSLGALAARAQELADSGAAAQADPAHAALLRDLQAELAKLQAARASEDPRLSFSAPAFKQAAARFSAAFRENFGREAEYALVKDHAWSAPALRKVGGEAKEEEQEKQGGAAGK
jgi:hypothetical protein